MQSVKFGEGGITTLVSAGTATGTSSPIPSSDTHGFNALRIYGSLSSTGTPNWTFQLQGALRADDTYVNYNSTIENSIATLTASDVYIVEDLFPFTRMVYTENSGAGTITVLAQPVVR